MRNESLSNLSKITKLIKWQNQDLNPGNLTQQLVLLATFTFTCLIFRELSWKFVQPHQAIFRKWKFLLFFLRRSRNPCTWLYCWLMKPKLGGFFSVSKLTLFVLFQHSNDKPECLWWYYSSFAKLGFFISKFPLIVYSSTCPLTLIILVILSAQIVLLSFPHNFESICVRTLSIN